MALELLDNGNHAIVAANPEAERFLGLSFDALKQLKNRESVATMRGKTADEL